jgi:hypothetical protein
MSTDLMAVVTTQGTAMPEATLCLKDFTRANIDVAERNASAADDGHPYPLWALASDNTEIECFACGAQSD